MYTGVKNGIESEACGGLERRMSMRFIGKAAHCYFEIRLRNKAEVGSRGNELLAC